jgi:hypothetical protein
MLFGVVCRPVLQHSLIMPPVADWQPCNHISGGLVGLPASPIGFSPSSFFFPSFTMGEKKKKNPGGCDCYKSLVLSCRVSIFIRQWCRVTGFSPVHRGVEGERDWSGEKKMEWRRIRLNREQSNAETKVAPFTISTAGISYIAAPPPGRTQSSTYESD